jgi:polysaccharide biosynthesis/export protein
MTSSSLLVRCSWALALFAAAIPAVAQFNGPAIGTGGAINQPNPVTTDQATLYPTVYVSRIAIGDSIALHVYGQPDLGSAVIDSDGNAEFPLIGKIKLAGLTAEEAKKALADKFDNDGIFRQPQISISIGAGAGSSITILGERQGVLPANGSRRLLEVLATEGGLPITASHTITVIRPGVAQPIIVQLSTDPARVAEANIPIFAGDTIVIAKLGVVYVVGAFRAQGTVNLTSTTPLTLLELTSLSGGPSFEGKLDDLRLIRTVGDHRTVVKLDLKKVLYGKAPDPILQPNDILFLPPSAWKSLITNGTLGTALGLVSFAISLAAVR